MIWIMGIEWKLTQCSVIIFYPIQVSLVITKCDRYHFIIIIGNKGLYHYLYGITTCMRTHILMMICHHTHLQESIRKINSTVPRFTMCTHTHMMKQHILNHEYQFMAPIAMWWFISHHKIMVTIFSIYGEW